MTKQEKKYNYIYMVIPTKENFRFYGCIYFGVHFTDDLNDGYICSSSIIGKWVKKHPNDYKKIIISYYNTRKEALEAEYYLIHPHLGEKYCLNRREGGEGGAMSPELCRKHAEAMKGRKQTQETINKRVEARKGYTHSDETRKLISQKNKGNSACGRPGHTYTEEQRRKYSLSKMGANNPNYKVKRKFINKDGITKFVLESELNDYLNNGWAPGMKKRLYTTQ